MTDPASASIPTPPTRRQIAAKKVGESNRQWRLRRWMSDLPQTDPAYPELEREFYVSRAQSIVLGHFLYTSYQK